MVSKTDRLIKSMKKQGKSFEPKTPVGSEMFLPNLSGDHSRGRVRTTPTTDLEIANKKYVDDNFLKNDAVDVGVGLTLTGDNTSADTAYVPQVLFNTDATPPAASGFTKGTIYIQYTA